MEGLSRQSQTVSQEESFETLDSYSSLERATHRELYECTGDTLLVVSRVLIVLVRIIGNNP